MKSLSKVEVRTGIRSVDGKQEYDQPGRKIGNRYDRAVRDFENTKRVALVTAQQRLLPQASTSPGFQGSLKPDYAKLFGVKPSTYASRNATYSSRNQQTVAQLEDYKPI